MNICLMCGSKLDWANPLTVSIGYHNYVRYLTILIELLVYEVMYFHLRT